MIKETLDQLWSVKKAKEAVFELRATVQNAYFVLEETVAKVDEIIARDSFKDVDSEIKSEGQAISQALKQIKDDLNSNHGEFIDWKQPAKKISHSA